MNIFDIFCDIFGSLPFIGKICHDDRSNRANELFGRDIFGGSRRTRRTRRNRRTRRK